MLSENQSRLVDSLLHGYLPDILELIDRIDDLNFSVILNNPTRTVLPIHLAVLHPKAERIVQAMIDNGAQVVVADHKGKSPLHYAQDLDKLDVAQILVFHQHELRTIPDNQLRTPLHDAADQEKLNFLKFYLNYPLKCNVDVPDHKEFTPLHLAALVGNQEAVTMLVKYGANVHARTESNNTPVNYACLHPEVKAILRAKMFPSLFLLSVQALALQSEGLDSLLPTLKMRAEQVLYEHTRNQQIANEKEKILSQTKSPGMGLMRQHYSKLSLK